MCIIKHDILRTIVKQIYNCNNNCNYGYDINWRWISHSGNVHTTPKVQGNMVINMFDCLIA